MPFSPPPRRSDPDPLEADDVAIVTLGTALWGIGLLVAIVLRERLADRGNEGWVWIFLAGVFLGLIGVRHVRRRRAALRRILPKPDKVDPR
jgi:MFS family permease